MNFSGSEPDTFKIRSWVGSVGITDRHDCKIVRQIDRRRVLADDSEHITGNIRAFGDHERIGKTLDTEHLAITIFGIGRPIGE